MPSAIVVGAGLAGLACARVLKEKRYDVIVLEKSDRVGGRIKTDAIDGFRFDHGFQVINPAYSEIRRLNILDDLEICHLAKGFEIELDGKNYLVGDPRESLNFLKGDLSSATGSLYEKIAFVSFIARRPRDLSFQETMQPSGKFYRKVVKGFLDGVFLTDSDQISSLVAHELLRWFVKGKPGVPALGMGELPRLLARGLDIRLNSNVRAIKDGAVSTDTGEISADFIVIAADPNSTRHLIDKPAVTMNPSWTWYHAVPKGLVASRYLKVLRHDPLVNSIALSNVATAYAPENETLISSTTLHEISEDQALEAVAHVWGVSKSDIRYLKRYEIAASLPFHGPHKPLEMPQQFSERVFLAGDSFSIPAQQGALRSGRLVAEKIIARR